MLSRKITWFVTVPCDFSILLTWSFAGTKKPHIFPRQCKRPKYAFSFCLINMYYITIVYPTRVQKNSSQKGIFWQKYSNYYGASFSSLFFGSMSARVISFQENIKWSNSLLPRVGLVKLHVLKFFKLTEDWITICSPICLFFSGCSLSFRRCFSALYHPDTSNGGPAGVATVVIILFPTFRTGNRKIFLQLFANKCNFLAIKISWSFWKFPRISINFQKVPRD